MRQGPSKELRKQKIEFKGLLTNFIADKVRLYVEPVRKGTVKGEPIGFSPAKHTASLCMLFNISIKDLAKDLQISYGLLRKWRTEAEFHEMMMHHVEEFKKLFVDRLREVTKRDEAFYEKQVRDAPLEELATGKIEYPIIEEFSDLSRYGGLLRFSITDYLADLATKGESIELGPWAIRLCDFFITHPIVSEKRRKPYKPDPRLEEKKREFKSWFTKTMLDDVINILKKTDIGDTERRRAIFTLASIRETISE